MAKLHYIFLLLVIATTTNANPHKRDANANEYMEKLLTNVRQLILEKNYDPYTAIDQKILNLHFKGELQGLSSLHLAGDANLKYNNADDNLEIDATFGVVDAKANFDWEINLGLFPLRGKVHSTIEDATVNVSLRADIVHKHVRITKFKVSRLGKIETKVEGFVIDKIISFVSTSVNNLLKNVVARLLEEPIRKFVQDTIDKIGFEGLP